ncbi:ABC transporter, putative [Eimeria tenella]|uniref:ABC transporter, putative n=1 Tax=Eimeria tenella TaxID=5802 RepID=U6KTN9_EIMTE|nr:ABC transporter, putative [Eimeria tenella]CDJ41457.1 ABC transporter, putative [Eimeria tenella]|eukprot:XP_013232207.1 ABC transporter, putative [Eimeria tenella]
MQTAYPAKTLPVETTNAALSLSIGQEGSLGEEKALFLPSGGTSGKVSPAMNQPGENCRQSLSPPLPNENPCALARSNSSLPQNQIQTREQGVQPVVLHCKDINYSVAIPQDGTFISRAIKRLCARKKPTAGEADVEADKRRKLRKEILCLDGIELVFNPGDFVALMGSSGAGKSTLLNCLSGRVSTGLRGEVDMNGRPCTPQLCKELSCFIQQEDLIFGYLTVEEHLHFQASLRLPKGTTNAEVKRTTSCLLESFGLAHISKSFIGGPHEAARGSISGGERKRLCIASELLSNPSVVFADEPTSGLDSFMAKAVCDQLYTLAAAGCTVLLLGEGRVLYYGDRLAAIAWLEHLGGKPCEIDANPAEYILKVTSLQHLDMTAKTKRLHEWAEAWKLNGQAFLKNWEEQGRDNFKQRSCTFSSILEPVGATNTYRVEEADGEGMPVGQGEDCRENCFRVSIDANKNGIADAVTTQQSVLNALTSVGATRNARKSKRISPFTEAWVLTKRGLLLRLRDPSTSYIRLAATLITALLPSFIYFQMGWNLGDAWNRVSACYQIVLTQSLACLFNVASLFPQARPVAQREYESGVIRMWVYFIGTSTSDTVLFLVFPLIFHLITFFIMGLASSAAKFFQSLGILLLSVLSLQSYGYFISAVVTDEVVALAVTQVIQVVLALFSGFMTQIDQLSPFFRVLAALSPFKYALSAFSVTILENEYFIGEEGERVSGDAFLEGTFGIKRETFASDLGALVGLIVV